MIAPFRLLSGLTDRDASSSAWVVFNVKFKKSDPCGAFSGALVFAMPLIMGRPATGAHSLKPAHKYAGSARRDQWVFASQSEAASQRRLAPI